VPVELLLLVRLPGSSDHTLCIHEAQSGRELRRLRGHESQLRWTEIGPPGFAVGQQNTAQRIRDQADLPDHVAAGTNSRAGRLPDRGAGRGLFPCSGAAGAGNSA